MTHYQIVRNGRTLPIAGDFDSIEEVKKLRVFKDNPHWIEFVAPVPLVAKTKVAKPAKKSNRWRYMSNNFDHHVDYTSSYTKQEFIEFMGEVLMAAGKIRCVTRSEYHKSDGIILSDNL